MPRFNLSETQRWMQEVIVHPKGARAGSRSRAAQKLKSLAKQTLEDVFEPSKLNSAETRVSIYANMYFWRLLEALDADFPVFKHLVGEERFEELIHQYVTAHPSTHFSLNFLGRHFEAFIRRESKELRELKTSREMLADLAGLEWHVTSVFDETRVPRLTAEDFAKLPPEKQGRAKLTLQPALRLWTSAYSVNAYASAVKDRLAEGTSAKSRRGKIPAPRRLSEKQREYVVIYRDKYSVYRLSQSREQFAILQAFQRGASLAAALEQASALPGVDLERLASQIPQWFQNWTTNGFFSAFPVSAKGNSKRRPPSA